MLPKYSGRHGGAMLWHQTPAPLPTQSPASMTDLAYQESEESSEGWGSTLADYYYSGSDDGVRRYECSI